jgi:hypothetical protein
MTQETSKISCHNCPYLYVHLIQGFVVTECQTQEGGRHYEVEPLTRRLEAPNWCPRRLNHSIDERLRY